MEYDPDLSDIEVKELKKIEVTALQSPVKQKSKMDRPNPVLGHICMLDIEDQSYTKVENALSDQRDIDLAFIFKSNSNENNYHVWIPQVKSLIEWKKVKDSISIDDNDHGLIGVEKNCYALRISEKGDKEQPVYTGYYSNNENLKKHIYSRPHIEYLMNSVDADGLELLNNIIVECAVVGDVTDAVVYETYENNHDVNDLADAEDVFQKYAGDTESE